MSHAPRTGRLAKAGRAEAAEPTGQAHVPVAEVARATGLPEERVAQMAQMIRANGLDDAQMAPLVRTACGSGVAPATILAMLTSLGIPSGRVLAVMRAQGVAPDEELDRLEAEQRAREAATEAGRAAAERRHRAKKALVIVFWLCVWQLLDTLMDNTLVLAGPVRTAEALVGLVAKPSFWAVCGASFVRIAAGFALSFVVGVALAILSYRVRTVRDFVEPIVSLLRTIPVVSIIIMLLIWVGNQLLTVYLSLLIVLPIIYTNMLTGLQNVDPKMLEMARVFGLSPWRRLMYVYRPAFMPFLVSSSKLSLGMSWKSGIMAEVLATPKPSIGKEMAQARTFLNTPDLFAWTVVVMLLSWAFERLVMWLLGLASRPAGARLGGGDDAD